MSLRIRVNVPHGNIFNNLRDICLLGMRRIAINWQQYFVLPKMRHWKYCRNLKMHFNVVQE